MKHSLATGALSERDLAWFEELVGTIARGRTTLLAHQESDCTPEVGASCAMRSAAWTVIAATDVNATSEPAVQRLLAADTPPDVGTTALVLTALARSGNAARQRCHGIVHIAINALLAAQNRDGGWLALNRDAKTDPSCLISTAYVLEALGHFGFRVGQPPIDTAVKFILAHQMENGSWANQSNVSALQLTWRVSAALKAVGFDVYELPVRRAVRWLKESQNEDAGWGGSTPTETAWALLALLAANEGESVEARAGAEFLVGTQRANGAWNAFTGTERENEPENELGALCFPLMALGQYLSKRTEPTESRKAHVRTDTGHKTSGPKSYRHTLAEM